MGKISEALTYGLTIRESADDGSDFTNPASDYRRLFLGEDGQLHVKDSAGAVTAIGGSALTVKDEGGALSTAATSLDFVGAGVVASGTGAAKTITIAGGGGLGLSAPVYAKASVTNAAANANDCTQDITPRVIALAAAQVTASVVLVESGPYYLTVRKNGAVQEQITISSSGTKTITPFTPAAGDTIWLQVSNAGTGSITSGTLDIASGGWG